ncbi:MAG: hypothetical protein FD143_362 [Ignavibacteria bacterium]|nr:MAG: hypothetical protein FD143_362 [Ignavibacteria bacterium]KAF0161950.1 MAG: hypothetical protein FD188_395 [Ignavibacteria bacterium]
MIYDLRSLSMGKIRELKLAPDILNITKKFALDVIQIIDTMPKTRSAKEIAKQLRKSGTSAELIT